MIILRAKRADIPLSMQCNHVTEDYEAEEKRQSVWSIFWLEEGPEPHVLPRRTFAKQSLQQLSALKRKFFSCVQSMWAAIISACWRISAIIGPTRGL